jgi:hypothetical protein
VKNLRLMNENHAFIVKKTGFSPQCQAQIDDLNSQIDHYTLLEIACQHPGGTPCDYSAEIAELDAEIYALQTSAACIVTTQVTTYVPVDNSSAHNDGLILESEMTTGSALATYQNAGVGVNHVEVLNHPEMFKNFNRIFDDPGFFKTLPR